MHKGVFHAALALATLLSSVHSCLLPVSASTLPEDELSLSGWKQVWACEFESTKDLKKWNIPHRSENANNELQFYTPDAVTVADGYLHVLARRQESDYQGRPRHYTSGLLNTQHKLDVRYGRFDIRFKVPAGKGLWPAFWMLPTSGAWPPEIDWMEILGHTPEILYITNHFGKHVNNNHPSHGPKKSEAKNPDFSEGFHTLTGIWTPSEIVCYVDGVKSSVSIEGVPDEKMFLILNLAVGGDWPGNPDEKTVFPAEMLVDYVRVYQKIK